MAIAVPGGDNLEGNMEIDEDPGGRGKKSDIGRGIYPGESSRASASPPASPGSGAQAGQ